MTGQYATPNRALKGTSLMMSPEMKARIDHLAKSAYGPKGMARWTEERIRLLMDDRRFLARVAGAGTDEGAIERKSLRLTEQASELVDQAVLQVRKFTPGDENTRSKVLRAAFELAIEEAAAKQHEEGQPLTIPVDAKPALRRARKPASEK